MLQSKISATAHRVDLTRFEYRKARTLGYGNIARSQLHSQTVALIRLDRLKDQFAEANKAVRECLQEGLNDA